jgi:hypothetical protein
MQLFSVSQIFETNNNMTTSEEEKIELFEHLDQHHPSLSNKLKWVHRNLRDTRLTRTPAYPTSFTTRQAQIQQDSKLSIKYRKQYSMDHRKAFCSRLADSASWDRCEEEETMEHLLYGCETTLQWNGENSVR